jgi:hypothetical protein
MDSRLDPVFRAIPRHAENSDTRQEIRRHEEQGQQRKNNERDGEEKSPELWEDSTVVSVVALKAFLENMLRDTSPGAAEKQFASAAASAETTVSAPTPPPPASQAAVAAKAYQKTYTATHAPGPAAPPPPATETAAPSLALTNDEIRTIHTLIGTLDALLKNGAQALTIVNTGGSFLQSIVAAANAALAS